MHAGAKENLLDYDRAHLITDTEAAELIAQAKNFLELSEKWITLNHPHLKR
jgi:hypothetical protein